jgi:preprotein translocase subunit YajC
MALITGAVMLFLVVMAYSLVVVPLKRESEEKDEIINKLKNNTNEHNS